jgi:hypothetical protein
MDSHSFENLDPDQHSPKKQDLDPHKVNADPKHCFSGYYRVKILIIKPKS